MLTPSLLFRVAAMSATALAATAMIIVVAPTPAQASLASVECVGTNDVAYSPGITSTPTTVTATSTTDYTACVVVNGFPITMAQDSTTVVVGVRSCSNLLGTHQGTIEIAWNTGQVTKANASFTTTQQGSVLVVTSMGTISSGPFTGSRLRRVVSYADVAALTECMSPGGLQNLSNGILTSTILPI